VGICSYTSATYNQQWAGFCICPNGDTSPDCVDQASSWCWLYANIIVSVLELSYFTVPIRKLMGAIPIMTTGGGYTFTELDCLSISNNGFIDPNLMSPGTSVTIKIPSPVFGQNQITTLTTPISQIQLSTLIQSAYPQTMDLDAVCPASTSLTDLLTILLPTIDFSKVYQRIVPGTFPTTCEQLLNTNYFIPNLAALNLTSTFSAESFQPVVSGPF